MKSMITIRTGRAARLTAIPVLAISIASGAVAQAPPAIKDQSIAISAKDKSGQPSSRHATRATDLIGMKVNGAQGKGVGEIKDLIVNMDTGDVRYALMEFDPGFFKSEKVFAVPLRKLSMDAEHKTLRYPDTSRQALDKAGVDKADWKTAAANRRYLDGLDENYGYKPPTGTSRSLRASQLIGKDVNSRAGKDIGDIKELVVDLGTQRISYAVLAFDPSWMAGEKLYAFPLKAFKLEKEKDDLMLDVDKSMVASMKAFDAKQWEHLNDLNDEAFINVAPISKN